MKQTLITLFLFLASVSVTQAYFSDTETASRNISAGTLAFTATATTTSGTSPTTFNFSVDNTGSHNPQYSFWVATSTCSGVSFSLSSLSNPFEGTHSVGVSGTPAASCQFSVLVSAWQQGFAYGSGGFTAAQTLNFNLTVAPVSANVVLNEFLPNPNGPVFGDDNDNKPKGEWVELYNGGSSPVNLTGWSITDASGGSGNTVVINAANAAAHLSPATTTIPAGGYLVVYMNKAVFNNTGGDTVKLLNASNVLVDSYTYTGTVADNKTFARVPDGGTWVDPIPSPGASNLTTVTRDDLEAEGWTEEKIDAVLGAEPVVSTESVEVPVMIEETVKEEATTTPEIITEEVILPEEEVIVEEEKTTDEVNLEAEEVVVDEPLAETPVEPTAPEPVEESVTAETYE